MLKKLYIKNYAILEEIEVDLGPGLNILTGETGAGKSILIGALSLLLGDRADTDFIRKGEEKAIVEGYFDISGIEKMKAILDEEDFEKNEEELIIRRELSVTGRSRAFINDSPATVSTIKKVSKYLVDIHGQHQHQSIFYEYFYNDIIDNYGKLNSLAQLTVKSYFRLENLKNNFKKLSQKKKELREQEDFLKYQLEEINKVNPLPGEDEILDKEILILENKEKVKETVSYCYNFLYDGEGSAAEKIKAAMKSMEYLLEIDPEIAPYIKDLESAYAIVEETGHFIRGFGEKKEYSQQDLEEMRQRLHVLNSLKRKFKGTLEDIADKKSDIESKLDNIENIDGEISKVADEIKAETDYFAAQCGELSLQGRLFP